MIVLAAILPDRGARPPTLALWPAADGWPTLEEVTRRHRLDRLWSALRGGTDRVLFLTSSLRLDNDPAWYAPHSHVTSLAPLRAGREIVHGTFTHPSPLAARFYTGQAVPPARLLTLAERLDGQRLLGEPWERLPAATFDRFARRLRIGTVVVPTADVTPRPLPRPDYAPSRPGGGVHPLRAARATLAARRADHLATLPRPRLPDRRRVDSRPAIPAYPLWHVKSAAGRLETRVDDWGLLEFRVPVDLFEAELAYAEGWLEWTAVALFAAGAGGWLVWAVRGRGPAAARVRRAGRS